MVNLSHLVKIMHPRPVSPTLHIFAFWLHISELNMPYACIGLLSDNPMHDDFPAKNSHDTLTDVLTPIQV